VAEEKRLHRSPGSPSISGSRLSRKPAKISEKPDQKGKESWNISPNTEKSSELRIQEHPSPNYLLAAEKEMRIANKIGFPFKKGRRGRVIRHEFLKVP